MLYILSIFTLFFGTPTVPTTLAEGIQKVVHTEGARFLSTQQKHQVIVCDLADDDDSDDSNDYKKIGSTPFCKTTTLSLVLSWNSIFSVSTFFSITKPFIQRRLFILFQVLKLDC